MTRESSTAAHRSNTFALTTTASWAFLGLGVREIVDCWRQHVERAADLAHLQAPVQTHQDICYHTKCWWGGNFPASPSICPTSPLVTANAPSVFCRFQLRSVTDEQRVRIMWFTRPSPKSHFGVWPRTHISSVRCFISFDVQQYIHIAYKWRPVSLDPGVPLVTARPCPFSLMFSPVRLSLKIPKQTPTESQLTTLQRRLHWYRVSQPRVYEFQIDRQR